jgi:hypothetical protein
MPNLFDPTKWTGEFFHPENFEGRFSGTLDYSPEDGILLTYRKADDTQLPDSDVLHGVLGTGEKCTLFGHFTLRGSGFSTLNGLHTKTGTLGFKLLAIGEFLTDDFSTDRLTFTLSGLQEFFGPRENSAKFQKSAIHTSQLPFGALEVWATGQLAPLSNDIGMDIYCEDTDDMNELSIAFGIIKEKFPNKHFMLKKRSTYAMALNLSRSTSIFDAYKYVASISDLFALLLDSPSHPESLATFFHKADTGISKIELYPSLRLNSATIKLAQKRKHHLQLPISASNFDFTSALSAWMTSNAKESVVISAMQHEVGFRTEHTAHGDVVLYSSQLESLSFVAGHVKDKYEYPVATYGTDNLLAALEKSLSENGVEQVGKAIGDLRNEIAHVGKPKYYLAKMTLRDLMDVTRCLQLVLTAHTLTSIGVTRLLICKYIDALLPR